MASPLPQSPHINEPPSHPSGEPLYLIRLSQSHESFRLPELHSLSTYFNIPLKIHEYSPTSPFCIVSFPQSATSPTSTPTDNISQIHLLAKQFITRSILSKGIYHLYASAKSYPQLHAQTQSLPPSTWTDFENVTFKFSIDAYRGKRSMMEQREIVEGFRYLPFRGRIRMSGAQEEFVVFEEWEGLGGGTGDGYADGSGIGRDELVDGVGNLSVTTSTTTTTTLPTITQPPTTPNTPTTAPTRAPTRLHFTRHLSPSQRPLIEKHDLKKRPYISTTSMDAELALLTAILAHVGPGRLTLDPFVGTGGFMVAAAELGAVTLGADIDGRSFRGKGRGVEGGVIRNFRRYAIESGFGDCVTGDLTNSMWRMSGRGRGGGRRWLDAVICDPPYGVREGLKVLGRRRGKDEVGGGQPVASVVNGDGLTHLEAQMSSSPSNPGPFLINGVPSHTLPGFIAPKRPYSFDAMLLDILDFAARTLVTGGRLAFWMPCANDIGTEEFGIPRDPKGLVLLRHVCVQEFNRWSRRLLVYERVEGEVLGEDEVVAGGAVKRRTNGHHADDLNQFRKMYFQGFNQGSSSASGVENEHG